MLLFVGRAKKESNAICLIVHEYASDWLANFKQWKIVPIQTVQNRYWSNISMQKDNTQISLFCWVHISIAKPTFLNGQCYNPNHSI